MTSIDRKETYNLPSGSFTGHFSFSSKHFSKRLVFVHLLKVPLEYIRIVGTDARTVNEPSEFSHSLKILT